MLTRPSWRLSVLEAAVGVLGLLPLLLDLRAQPLPRLGGGLEAQVQALLDVELGEGVRGGGGEVRAAGADADVDEAAVADGLDGGAAEEAADGPFDLRALPGRLGEDGVDLGLVPRPAVLGVVQEVEVLDDAPGEAAALQQLVLRLVVVVDAPAALVLLRDALEVEDVGVLLLDEELGGRLVDGLGEERAQRGEGDDRGEDGEEEAAAAQEDVDVVPEVGLALRAGPRKWARWSASPSHLGLPGVQRYSCAKPLRALEIVAENGSVVPRSFGGGLVTRRPRACSRTCRGLSG